MRIEIDGHVPSAEALWSTASAFGHFTAMQVRGGRTRGLELHLRRLNAATQELFGSDVEGERIRTLVRHALGDVADASVRVYVFESEDPVIMVTVKEPAEIAAPQRLQSVAYQRPSAHLKHLATEQGFYSRFARLGGFDDALLTADGRISESATANVAFLDEEGVVWPEGQFLHGITMQLLERALPDAGVASRRAPLHLADIRQFRGALVSNARGVAPVSAIDGRPLGTDASRVRALADVYAALPWDPI